MPIIDPQRALEGLQKDPFLQTLFGALSDSEACLVGGSLRDLLLGRDPHDFDFAVHTSPEHAAEVLVRAFGGRQIQLGSFGTRRVILPDRNVVDLTSIQADLERDLSMRDFTINAMAWSPGSGLIDLHGGISDLSERKIRMVEKDNLAIDPLRMLRAYRLGQELNFDIECATRESIKSLKNGILAVKPERITLELNLILSGSVPHITLWHAYSDGILAQIFSCNNEKFSFICNEIAKLMSGSVETAFKVAIGSMGFAGERFPPQARLAMQIILLNCDVSHVIPSSRVSRNVHKIRALMPLADAAAMADGRERSLFELFRAAGRSAVDMIFCLGLDNLVQDYVRYSSIRLRDWLSELTSGELEQRADAGKIIGLLTLEVFMGNVRSRGEAEILVKELMA